MTINGKLGAISSKKIKGFSNGSFASLFGANNVTEIINVGNKGEGFRDSEMRGGVDDHDIDFLSS